MNNEQEKHKVLGEDVRQFNLEKTFKNFVTKDKSMANRIDEVIRIKTKNVNTLNYIIDVMENAQQYLDAGGKVESHIKECHNKSVMT